MTNLQNLNYTCHRNTLNFILLLLLIGMCHVPLCQTLAENANRYQPKLGNLKNIHVSQLCQLQSLCPLHVALALRTTSTPIRPSNTAPHSVPASFQRPTCHRTLCYRDCAIDHATEIAMHGLISSGNMGSCGTYLTIWTNLESRTLHMQMY
jgi:hypothetical protein